MGPCVVLVDAELGRGLCSASPWGCRETLEQSLLLPAATPRRSGFFWVTSMCFPSPPGLHPHQTPPAMANPGLYPPPVSMPPGQPPPQQLITPTYFSAPGVMNFGNPGYPYPPGALPPPPPPHLYSNTQVSRVCRGSFPGRSRRDAGECGVCSVFLGEDVEQLGCSVGKGCCHPRKDCSHGCCELPECGGQWVKSCPGGGSGIEVFPYGAGKRPLQGPAEPRIPWEWLWRSILFEVEAGNWLV